MANNVSVGCGRQSLEKGRGRGQTLMPLPDLTPFHTRPQEVDNGILRSRTIQAGKESSSAGQTPGFQEGVEEEAHLAPKSTLSPPTQGVLHRSPVGGC